METAPCPLCSANFDIIELISHVDTCQGISLEEDDPDLKLAKELQEEEKKNSQSRKSEDGEESRIKCQKCQKSIKTSKIYILDDCSHKLCIPCHEGHVINTLYKTATVACPIMGCNMPLSVRDVKEFSKPRKSPTGNTIFKTNASGKATERLMSELKHIMAADPDKNGYSAEPIDDDLYTWEIRLFNFDSETPLAADMKRCQVEEVLLHAIFPKNYPFTPPYIRVISPRFAFHTGHITVGGSICFELLTLSFWTPETTLEAVIICIRTQIIEGNGRLDHNWNIPYTEEEAKAAYVRVARQHGWEVELPR